MASDKRSMAYQAPAWIDKLRGDDPAKATQAKVGMVFGKGDPSSSPTPISLTSPFSVPNDDSAAQLTQPATLLVLCWHRLQLEGLHWRLLALERGGAGREAFRRQRGLQLVFPVP